ncbi:tyrosine-type recombinase/integrase [Bacillus sp. AP8]|nr:tyrosine-type recombinase/integrase [Bacillus sp. AP8]
MYDINQLYVQKLQTGLANATVKLMHNILSKAFQKALKWGLIKRKDALADYKLQQDEHPMDLVFPSKNGTYLEPRNLLRKYKMLIKKANVPYIPFHNLRHTHATILMRMGENPKVVSERLGHARVGITLDIYSHTNEEMQKKTAERFDENFWT